MHACTNIYLILSIKIWFKTSFISNKKIFCSQVTLNPCSSSLLWLIWAGECLPLSWLRARSHLRADDSGDASPASRPESRARHIMIPGASLRPKSRGATPGHVTRVSWQCLIMTQQCSSNQEGNPCKKYWLLHWQTKYDFNSWTKLWTWAVTKIN